MGAIARKLESRLSLPRAALLGAALLAFILAFPTAGEARFNGVQLGVKRECKAELLKQDAIPRITACLRKGEVLAKDDHRLLKLSGKLGAALAAELYCRIMQTEVSEITRRMQAYLPHPAPKRLIETNVAVAIERPGGGFEPAPDNGLIEVLPAARRPDG